MTIAVEHWNNDIDGQLTEQAMRVKLQKRGYSVSRYTYPAGTVFAEHSHRVDKIDAVLSGLFRLTIEGQSLILVPGDCIAVPKEVIHRAEVIGSDPVISLDAVRIQTGQS